ncbi:MAG: hypothetical protein M1822_004314 [Bathelium mastoideum]|nr:MAG: hypothetical protein M1822_004314 [Bathelium mastoideum]
MASSSQLDRYAKGYRTLYPTAQILLLRPPPPTLVNSASSPTKHLAAALDVLTPPRSFHSSSVPSSPPLDTTEFQSPASSSPRRGRSSSNSTVSATTTVTGPPVLLHLFGTPAAASACALLRLYRTSHSTPLPVQAIVLDAVPSPSPRAVLHDAVQMQPWLRQSAWSLVLLLVYMVVSWWTWVCGREAEEETRVRRELNGGEVVPTGARKAYVFPGKEMLFSWKEDGGGGGERGEREVMREKGEVDGEDVRRQWTVKREKVGRGRWSGDEERFWEGIEALWEGREG